MATVFFKAILAKMMRRRCEWAEADPLLLEYHDREWGVPVHDDQTLFEFLILEGAQAGLSWLTILKKREGYREGYEGFEIERVAQYGEKHVRELLSNSGIVRNKRKIESSIQNARAILDLRGEFESFDHYLWRFVGSKPRNNAWQRLEDIPPNTKESSALSKDLKHRGFQFVGTTMCYAFMQAIGMVNDHLIHCVRYGQIQKETKPSSHRNR